MDVKISAAIKMKEGTEHLKFLCYFGRLVKCLLKITLTKMVVLNSPLYISSLKLRASYNEVWPTEEEGVQRTGRKEARSPGPAMYVAHCATPESAIRRNNHVCIRFKGDVKVRNRKGL